MEEWRIVSVATAYEVSSLGRVRNVRTGLVLKGTVYTSGYYHVSLYDGGERVFHGAVHRLVLTAFRGAPPFNAAVCRHLDNNPRNNAIENLVWGTQLENIRDQRRHGTRLLGARHPNAKLNAAQVAEIRLRASEPKLRLAQQFGVDRNVIYAVIARTKYQNVPEADAHA